MALAMTVNSTQYEDWPSPTKRTEKTASEIEQWSFSNLPKATSDSARQTALLASVKAACSGLSNRSVRTATSNSCRYWVTGFPKTLGYCATTDAQSVA